MGVMLQAFYWDCPNRKSRAPMGGPLTIVLSSWSDCGPHATVVGWHRKRRFLRGNDAAEIKIAAVEFFDVVAADWKPKRYCLIVIAGVNCNKRIRRAVVTGE